MMELLETLLIEQRRLDELDYRRLAGSAALAGALVTGPMSGPATAAGHSQVSHSEQEVINAIVGEASDGGYEGMLDVACAIRNRMRVPYYKHDPLKGVYGKSAAHVKTESPDTFALAKKAWADSATKDTVGGAYLWGYGPDIRSWKLEARRNPDFWFNNVVQTVSRHGHTFFKDK